MRFTTNLRPLSCLPNQSREPVSGILSISVLTAKPPGIEHHYSILSDPSASQPDEPATHIFGQGRRVNHIEAKLHRGGYLVDILSPRP